MSAISAFYEEPMILSSSTGHQRIYAQIAYRTVREQCFVPAVLGEAAHLARMFPLCWRILPEGPVLGALRSLLPGGRGHPSDASMHESLLPLVLQAFPIIVPDPEAIAHQQLLFDNAIADKPTDIGAPLLMADGHLSRAALTRAKKAVAIARALEDTAALSRDLLAAGLLEPWPLKFDLGQEQEVDIGDLMVLSASRLHHQEVSEIVLSHGTLAGLFMSLHRASLFRISTLLSAARKAVEKAGQPLRAEPAILPT